MRGSGLPLEPAVPARRRAGVLRRAARRAAHARLAGLEHGCVEIEEGGERRIFGRATALVPLRVRVVVEDPALYTALASGGIVGAGESWMRGEWSCDDLAGLVRILLRNPGPMDGFDAGLSRLAELPRRALHRLRRNGRRGSRRNIRAHYDLGNDFFEAFLDPTLTYSCGVFERPDASMEEASIAKYERLCRKLELGPGDHVLEIGSGWGGFALHAASRYGCRVTTTTISPSQLERARERVARAGLSDRVTVLLEDYRDLRGSYDKLVSIEMIEAVGHEYFDTYFAACARRLRPEGRMALQAIVIADQAYERATRSVDFIKRWVFPGGCLPSVAAIAASTARASDLRVQHLEDLTPHYAETLRRWRQRFGENRRAIRALGYEDWLLRMWEFYLGYCEGGFEERHIGLVQMVLARPGWRPAHAGGGVR